MPELPEVEALRRFLEPRLVGRTIARVHLVAFSVLRSVRPPLEALPGLEIESVQRFGKYVVIEAQGVFLAFHLARAGWLVWRDAMPAALPRPGKGPLAFRLVLDDDAGFDLTEAGTQRKLAIHVTTDPMDIERIRTLGPDPLADDFTVDDLATILNAAGRSQLKGVLRDQQILAGIGNAYSDEILHAAKMSPFKAASTLTDAERQALFDAIQTTLRGAITRADGLAAKDLKDDKRSNMAVHGRTGQPCPVCGTTVAEVSFADSSLQYCPTCQTGGKLLADRRLSRLLK